MKDNYRLPNFAERLFLEAQRKALEFIGAKFLSLDDVSLMCESIADRANNEYSPNHIIGISRAGEYPAHQIAKHLNIPLDFIDISRNKNYIGNIEVRDIVGLSFLTRPLQAENPTIRGYTRKNFEGKRVLVVDDDSGRGHTLNIARKFIEESNPVDIKTAVLHISQDSPANYYQGFKTPLVMGRLADIRYPWTQCSPHYKEFVKNHNVITSHIKTWNRES